MPVVMATRVLNNSGDGDDGGCYSIESCDGGLAVDDAGGGDGTHKSCRLSGAAL